LAFPLFVAREVGGVDPAEPRVPFLSPLRHPGLVGSEPLAADLFEAEDRTRRFAVDVPVDCFGRQADGECRLARFSRLFGKRRELGGLRLVELPTLGCGRVGARSDVNDFGVTNLLPPRSDRVAGVLSMRKLGADRDQEYRGERARRG